MKSKLLGCILFIALALTGCSGRAPQTTLIKDDSPVAVGEILVIDGIDDRFLRQDSGDLLAMDGMYYVSWVMDDAKSSQDAGDSGADSYSARVHLLLQQFTDAEKASENRDGWLAAGRENYSVLSEEEISCSGVDYTFITYNIKSPDNPYERGASALGVFGSSAVCVELMCREDFEEDAGELLTAFLESCSVH